MKKDWELKKLGEVTQICLGLTHTPKYQETGIPFISVKDISSGNLSFDNTKRIAKEEYDSMPWGAKPKKGDVLFCRVGTIGIPQIVKTDVEFGIFVSVGFFRTYEILFNEYLKYWLYSDNFFYQVEKNVVGSTIKNLNTGWLKNFTLPLPPLEEQKRIVKILDEKFAQLETIKTNAQINLQNAKDLFQSQLTKAFSNTTWEKKRLDEVCAITSKLVDPTLPEYLDLYHVGGANIESETGILLDLKTSKEEGLSSGKFTFDESMVLYNKIRPYLKKVARPDFAGLCSADMYPLNPKNNITKDYLYYILISDDFTKYAISKSDRAGMPKVNREALFAYECYLPPLPEQKRIVKELDTLSEKVRQLQEIYTKQISDCDELKQSLLQKAFEGEL